MGEAPERMVLVETLEDVDRLQVADPEKVAYLTQTTLSVDEAQSLVDRLQQRFPRCVGSPKEDICYATQNRQEALKALLPQADVALVVGSRNSSNSNRLVDVAREHGVPAYLVDDAEELESAWFEGADGLDHGGGQRRKTSCWPAWRRSTAVLAPRWRRHSIREEDVTFLLPAEVR